jgi:hypothetical protein
MRSRLDVHPLTRASRSRDVRDRCPGGAWPAPGSGDHVPEAGCDVTVRLHLDGPHPVVSVVGALERPGGALLTAVLEYLRQTHSGPVTVDLSRVSDVDQTGLAPVIAAGVDVDGASARVDRILTGLTGSAIHAQVPPRTCAGIRQPALPRAAGVRDDSS